MKSRCYFLALLLLLLATAACAGATPAEPTPTPNPATILQQAGETMQALGSARFEMTRSGAPVYLDPEQQLLFNAASGQYAAPDAVRAVIRVQALGLALEVNMVAIGDDQWLTNPLTRQWEQLPPGWGFNPAVIFDPALGWQPLLNEDISALSPPELVEIDGRAHYHISGTVRGERVRVITAGLAGAEPVQVAFWVDAATRHVTRLQFVTLDADGEPAVWLLTFTDFDAPVTIEPPAN